MDGVDEMLQDLRSQFNRRIPGGLTAPADDRLQKTLTHYVNEVARVGSGGARDILRMTYDSMVKWIKKGTESFKSPIPKVDDGRFETEMDPAAVFASIKAARNQGDSSGPAPAPFRMPDLQTVPDKRTPVPSTYGVQQKDVLQPHEDTVKYREVEYNLVMNSKDRDWIQNTTQNRYNFVIQFNTNYKPQGASYQAHINARLRNVVRLEFIKAILPVEGLNVIVPKSCDTTNVPNPQNAFYSALALPSVNVLVDEMEGNSYGTSNDIDKSLAVCQYDATWRSESVWNKPNVNRGYSLFFPKFMKAQRIYTPAPLSNLQTLSFRLQDPEGNLLSSIPDSSVIAELGFSNTLFNGTTSSSCYLSTSLPEYIFLRTKEWFSLWSYSQLDKILLQGLTTTTQEGSAALNEWLQKEAGHSVVGTGWSDGLTGLELDMVNDGFNDVGYANWIIIRNRYVDPATGSTDLQPFSSNDDALAGEQTGGVLNLSRQVQLSIRVITREYDLVSNVRSDNV